MVRTTFFSVFGIKWKVNQTEFCLLISLLVIRGLNFFFVLRLSQDLSASEEHLKASHVLELTDAVRNQSSK